MAELGLPQLAGDIWFAISTPARTSPAIIETLQREMAAIISSPAVRQKFAPLGLEVIGNTPAGNECDGQARR